LCYTPTKDRGGQTGHWKNVLQRRRGGRRHIGVGGSPRGLSATINIIIDSCLYIFIPTSVVTIHGITVARIRHL